MSAAFEILYVSDLAPDYTSAVVRDILTVARATNQRLDITGLLVFDGQHFVQLIEGEEVAVKQLMYRIEHDRRHCNIVSLHEGRIAARRFARFSMGYSYAEGDEAVIRLQDLRGEAATAAFMAAVPSFDLDG
jgi:hypothetical protein